MVIIAYINHILLVKLDLTANHLNIIEIFEIEIYSHLLLLIVCGMFISC